MKFIATHDQITVLYKRQTHVVPSTAANYPLLLNALMCKDYAEAAQHLEIETSISAWSAAAFTIQENRVLYLGKAVPESFGARILEMYRKGEDPAPLFAFYERLACNPSKRSVEQLWGFLQHLGIPIEPTGHFLAYKGIRADHKDCHSGTIDNHPGQVVSMPREAISDDPNYACHAGLHVGSEAHAKGYGSIMIICRVDPADVVCVPFDASAQKMRVCKYEVIGYHSGTLSSTVHKPEPSAESEDDIEDQEHFEDDIEDEDDSPPDLTSMGPSAMMQQPYEVLVSFARNKLKMIGELPRSRAELVDKMFKLIR